MAIQTSGAISLSDVRAEWGGNNPTSMSEYYGVDTGVPTSGTIDLSDFYGTSAFTPTYWQAVGSVGVLEEDNFGGAFFTWDYFYTRSGSTQNGDAGDAPGRCGYYLGGLQEQSTTASGDAPLFCVRSNSTYVHRYGRIIVGGTSYTGTWFTANPNDNGAGSYFPTDYQVFTNTSLGARAKSGKIGGSIYYFQQN